MEISFSELRSKTVINLIDGRRLGHIIDLIFEQASARILGIIVPGQRGGLFKQRDDIYIPYQCICKIGLDTILVELNPVAAQNTRLDYKDGSRPVVVEANTAETGKSRHYTEYKG